MPEPDNRPIERPSMEPDRAQGILSHLLSDLRGVVYRCRNDRDWTMLGLTTNVDLPLEVRTSENAETGIRTLPSEIAFVQKPFTPDAFLRAVGEELLEGGA